MVRGGYTALVMMLNRWLATTICLAVIATANASHASESQSNDHTRVVGIEYLAPIDENRDISTVVVDFDLLIYRLESLRLSAGFGITGTYATGNIVQLEGSLEAGTLREVQYDNSAFGLGPGLLASFQLFDSDRLSSHLNGNGNIIIYSQRFPSGGDYYNFMWRVGPTLDFKLDESRAIVVGFQVAHISNGQHFRPRNPSYDARGFALMFRGFF